MPQQPAPQKADPQQPAPQPVPQQPAPQKVEPKMPLTDDNGRLVINRVSTTNEAKAEVQLMQDVLDGKPLSDEQMRNLGSILVENRIPGNVDQTSTADKGKVGQVIAEFNKERLQGDGVTKQIVPEEIREAIAELYVYGALDNFVLSPTKEAARAELKDNAKSGNKGARLAFLKNEIKLVASARALKKKQIQMAEKMAKNSQDRRRVAQLRKQFQERDSVKAQEKRLQIQMGINSQEY
jgi:hypothetical protein